jgi:hypothetical protein
MVVEVRVSQDIAVGRNVVAALDVRLGLDAADRIFVEDALVSRPAA